MADCQAPLTHPVTTDKMTTILQNDEKTKKKLIEIYQDVQTFLSNDPDETLEGEISAHYSNYRQLLETYPKDLKGDERPVVVTGETSSGKSSVLNLLLGFDVLPIATLPCTGTVCRLRTGQMRKADIIDFDGITIETISLENDDEKKFKKDLKDYINPKKNRDRHKVKYVDIYWPIPFLKENVIVVDTPGIGESEEMTDRLVQYLPKAVALIYVIDPTHAGGIAEDRIVKLFKAIQREGSEGGIKQSFDPTCALFLCNKWDLLVEDEEDADEVWGHIKDKLEKYWPNLKEEQIFRFSAKKTLKKMAKKKQLPEEFITFRERIIDLIEISLGSKSRQHIMWLQKFLVTIRMSLLSHLSNIKLSGSQKKKQINRGSKLLQMLEVCRETSKTKLEQEAEDACNELAKKINDHVHDEKNRSTMFPWEKEKLPEKGDDLDDIKKEAYAIIKKLVSEELNRSLKLYGGKAAQERLMAKVQKETDGIRKAKFGLEKLLQEPDKMDEDELETIEDIIQNTHIDEEEISKGAIAVIAVTSPIWFPLALVGGLIGIPVALVTLTFKDTLQVGKYRRNKVKYLDKWSNKYLAGYSEKDIYTWLRETVFKTFYENLDELFDKELPQTINGCRKLFDNLQNEVRSADSIRINYQPRLEECNRILAALESLSY